MEEMLDKILQIESKYTELGQILSDPEVIQDYNRFKALSKQRKAMEETVEVYHSWKESEQAVKEKNTAAIIKNKDFFILYIIAQKSLIFHYGQKESILLKYALFSL